MSVEPSGFNNSFWKYRWIYSWSYKCMDDRNWWSCRYLKSDETHDPDIFIW